MMAIEPIVGGEQLITKPHKPNQGTKESDEFLIWDHSTESVGH